MKYLILLIFLISCASIPDNKDEALANWYCNYKKQTRKSTEWFEDCFIRTYIKLKHGGKL